MSVVAWARQSTEPPPRAIRRLTAIRMCVRVMRMSFADVLDGCLDGESDGCLLDRCREFIGSCRYGGHFTLLKVQHAFPRLVAARGNGYRLEIVEVVHQFLLHFLNDLQPRLRFGGLLRVFLVEIGEAFHL